MKPTPGSTLADDMIELQTLIASQRADRMTGGRINDSTYSHISMSLESAGLEELGVQEQPLCGSKYMCPDWDYRSPTGGVQEYVWWFSDNEDSRWENN